MGHICWGEQGKGKCRIHWKTGHQARQWLSCIAAYCKAALKSVALSSDCGQVLVQERKQFKYDIFSKGTLEGFICSAHLQATMSSLWKENKTFPPQLEGKAWARFTGREKAFSLSLSLLFSWAGGCPYMKVTHRTWVRGKVQSKGGSYCSCCHLSNHRKCKHQLCREW